MLLSLLVVLRLASGIHRLRHTFVIYDPPHALSSDSDSFPDLPQESAPVCHLPDQVNLVVSSPRLGASGLYEAATPYKAGDGRIRHMEAISNLADRKPLLRHSLDCVDPVLSLRSHYFCAFLFSKSSRSTMDGTTSRINRLVLIHIGERTHHHDHATF